MRYKIFWPQEGGHRSGDGTVEALSAREAIESVVTPRAGDTFIVIEAPNGHVDRSNAYVMRYKLIAERCR